MKNVNNMIKTAVNAIPNICPIPFKRVIIPATNEPTLSATITGQ